MISFTIEDAARAAGGKLISGPSDRAVKGFSIDSRTIERGMVFIAVKGENFDGHNFVKDAVSKGAAGIITEMTGPTGLFSLEIAQITVADTRKALAAIAAEIRKRVSIPVICITGSNGKTTVKEMLSEVLSSRYNVLKSRDSFNNLIGLSLSLFQLEETHEIAVLELGTNHPGEIRALAEIAAPDVAIITNIGNSHLEYFGDKNGVYSEKISLIDALPDSGMVFLPADDPLLSQISAVRVRTKRFGTSEGSDYRISDAEKQCDGYNFKVNGIFYHLPMEARHNVLNAAAAIAVADTFGITEAEIKEALKRATRPKWRLEKTKVGEVCFINDAYNANPDSFESALQFFEEYEAPDKIVVAGEMRELGRMSEKLHYKIGRSIARKGFDCLIVVGSAASKIADGAVDEGMKKEAVIKVDDHEDAAGAIHRVSRPGSAILLKGSRGSRMEEVIKCFTTCCIR